MTEGARRAGKGVQQVTADGLPARPWLGEKDHAKEKEAILHTWQRHGGYLSFTIWDERSSQAGNLVEKRQQ